nr:unnamed protein product [Spirometra erinaceieuropaei]
MSNAALQGYPENLPEAPADQPNKLGRPRSGPTYVEENSEATRITAAKAKSETRKSQLPPPPPPPPPQNANAQSPRTRSRCQRTFRASDGLDRHLWTNCGTQTAPIVVFSSTSPQPPTPSTNVDRLPNHHYHPPPPPLPPQRQHQQTPTSPSSISQMRAWSIPVLIVFAPSP